MIFSLAGKSAVVTGAGRGMGRAIAITYAEHGADLVLTGRDMGRLEEVAGEVEKRGRRAICVSCDLLNPADAARPVARAAAEFGRLDILVNNAGGAGIYVEGGAQGILDTTLETVEGLFKLNTFSPFVLAQAAARIMKESGGGSIINVTSNAAFAAPADVHAYAASKAALHNFTLGWSKDLAKYNIRVNEIAPGAVETHNLSKRLATEEGRKVMAGGNALGRLGQPDDIASAALYLASDEASWIVGATLLVTGGAK